MQEIIAETLDSGGYSHVGDYRVAAVGGQFLSVVHNTYDNLGSELNGWKIHLYLDESDRGKLISAYQQIAHILTQYNVHVSKFKTFSMTLDAESHPSERGRQVTIYSTSEDNVNWKELLETITRVLIDLNLPPGFPNPVCRSINGSNYFGYRNDQDESGSYISCRQVYMNDDILPENKYNPGNYDDPLLMLVIEVENQLERQDVQDDNQSCCCRFQ